MYALIPSQIEDKALELWKLDKRGNPLAYKTFHRWQGEWEGSPKYRHNGYFIFLDELVSQLSVEFESEIEVR